MSTLITNIAELVTNAPEHAARGAAGAAGFGALTGAALVIDDAHVAWCGPAAKAPAADEVFDAWRPRRAARVRRLSRAPGLRR